MTITKYESQLKSKYNFLSETLTPFYEYDIDVFESQHEHYRMRAEFRVWHDGEDTFHIMFDPDTKEKYRVDDFPAGSKLINLAMEKVISKIKSNPKLRNKLYQIDYLTTLSNQLLITLIYKKPIDESWIKEAQGLKAHLNEFAATNIIGRARKQKIELDNDYVTERLSINGKEFSFKQIENSFTQPNAGVNEKMIEWAIEQSNGLPNDLLELYCGAGNFSIPLAQQFNKVLGTEISRTSVKAAQINISENKISNLKIAKLSSEEFSQAFLHNRQFRRLSDIHLNEYYFSTVLVDPPRAGLDPLTEELVSYFDNVIYISCNPMTLVDNLHKLTQTHTVKRAALFDQFPYTEHIESGVFLQKNREP